MQSHQALIVGNSKAIIAYDHDPVLVFALPDQDGQTRMIVEILLEHCHIGIPSYGLLPFCPGDPGPEAVDVVEIHEAPVATGKNDVALVVHRRHCECWIAPVGWERTQMFLNHRNALSATFCDEIAGLRPLNKVEELSFAGLLKE